jgi:hypothetical protein
MDTGIIGAVQAYIRSDILLLVRNLIMRKEGE